MLPTPTAEMMLLLGLLAALTAENPDKCSKLSHALLDRLGPREPRRVRELREVMPAMTEAKRGAAVVMQTRCVVCPCRQSCKAPVVID